MSMQGGQVLCHAGALQQDLLDLGDPGGFLIEVTNRLWTLWFSCAWQVGNFSLAQVFSLVLLYVFAPVESLVWSRNEQVGVEMPFWG